MIQPHTAYFVCLPRRLSDLNTPHPLKAERPYKIVAETILPKIDFENFSEDLLADRTFLLPHASTCGTGKVFRCLLVRPRKSDDGILVVPQGDHVYYAAALPRAARS